MSVQVRPNGFLIYKDREQEACDSENLAAGREKLSTAGYNGTMSAKAVSKVKKYVTNWVTALNSQGGNAFAPLEAQAGRLRFVTLTLPASQQHEDNVLKRVFSTWFVQLLKRRHGVENYLWRAETQKNGNLHFHVLIDKPVPHMELRRMWNSCLEPYGYIARYRAAQQAHHAHGFKFRPELAAHWPWPKQLDAYHHGRETNWSQPNTTDIHALRKVKNVVAYVVKYVSKNDPNRSVEGRLWGSSDGVKQMERFVLMEDKDLLQLLAKGVEDQEVALCSGDGWSFYTCNTRSMLEQWIPGGSDMFISHWNEQAGKLAGKSYIHTRIINTIQKCSQATSPHT